MDGDFNQLVDCLCGVLFSGAGKPRWPLSVFRPQLKTIQEVITLIVFSVFSVVYLKEGLRWNHIAGFLMIIGAVFFVFKKW